MIVRCTNSECVNDGIDIDVGDPPVDFDTGEPIMNRTVLCGPCGSVLSGGEQ